MGVRASLWELKIGGCLAQGLSYEVGAFVVFINKGAPAEVGVWRSGTPLRWGMGLALVRGGVLNQRLCGPLVREINRPSILIQTRSLMKGIR